MDKKQIVIGIILSFLSAGTFLVAILIMKILKSLKVKKQRIQLESYIDKYFSGNNKLLAFVGTLSDDQVKILIKVIQKATEKSNDIKIKNLKLPKKLRNKFIELVD
jgi:hypothetical protein